MKKHLLIFGVFLWLIQPSAFGQIDDGKLWHYGIKSGLSAGAPIPDKLEKGEDGELGIGPLFGLYLKYTLSPKIYIETNLYYDSRGNSPYTKEYRRDTIVNVNFGSTPTQLPTFYTAWVNGTLQLRYLTLPVSASWLLKKWIAIQLGGQIHYLLKASDQGTAKIIVGEGGVVDDIYRTFQNKNDIQRWDYGGHASVAFYLLPELQLQIRYHQSIRSIYRPGFFADNNLPERKFKNQHLHISLAYQLK